MIFFSCLCIYACGRKLRLDKEFQSKTLKIFSSIKVVQKKTLCQVKSCQRQ